jgi:hypothetical protein
MERQAVRRVQRYCGLVVVGFLVAVLNLYAQDRGHAASGQQNAQAAPAAIPVVNAEMGPCSVEFTVTDPNYKPVRDAKVSVRISYGFMGVRRLDLEASTNVDGKARFVGLPNNLKHALYFYAEQGKLRGTAVNDAGLKCNATHILTMRETADSTDENQSGDSTEKPADAPDQKRQP